MKSSLIKNSSKFPSFIKRHKIFSKFKKINKIFPNLGLDNCSQLVSRVDYRDKAAKDLKKLAITEFRKLRNYHNLYAEYNDSYRRISNACDSTIADLKRHEAKEFISDNGNIICPLRTNLNVLFLKTRFQENYRLYKNNSSYYQLYNHLEIDAGTRVVFSYNAWDLATMSMRGISSCQSWNGSYRRNLIGSIIDPYCAVIYITHGDKLKLGTKMVRRALVRYVVNKETNKPALLLERIYPTHEFHTFSYYDFRYYDPARDPIAAAIFSKFLEEKVDGKIPVVMSSARQYQIPNSKINKAMKSCGSYSDGKDYCRSYRDSGITYSDSHKSYFKSLSF